MSDPFLDHIPSPELEICYTHSPMRSISSLLLVSAVMLMSGCASNNQNTQRIQNPAAEVSAAYGQVILDRRDEPVDFSTTGFTGTVETRKNIYSSSKDIQELIDASARGDTCGEPLSQARIEVLQNAYKNEMSIHYTVMDTSQPIFTVWLLPNKGYENQEMVDEDWSVCAAGSFSFVTLNEDWVVFAIRNSVRDVVGEPSTEDLIKTIHLR